MSAGKFARLTPFTNGQRNLEFMGLPPFNDVLCLCGCPNLKQKISVLGVHRNDAAPILCNGQACFFVEYRTYVRDTDGQRRLRLRWSQLFGVCHDWRMIALKAHCGHCGLLFRTSRSMQSRVRLSKPPQQTCKSAMRDKADQSVANLNVRLGQQRCPNGWSQICRTSSATGRS